MLALSVAGTGCSLTAAGGSGDTLPEDTLVAPDDTGTTVTSAGGTRTTTVELHRAELVLAAATGSDASDMHLADAAPNSPGANVVVLWQGGRAEVDDSTGTVYLASMEQPSASPGATFMTEDRLEVEAVRLAGNLGWPEGTLAGLGFKQRWPGALVEGTGLYTITWTQFDSNGQVQDGSIVMELEGRTAQLVRFSVWLGTDAPDIAGTISESAALIIAQTQIYLHTSSPKISLTGDGSLILINRSVSEQLTEVKDTKIVSQPTLCWVITITGVVAQQIVGGTVYMDARTGEVLKYQAYKTSEPATTSTSSLE